MIHHKSFYRFVILVPVLLVFAACKSVAVLPTKKPIKKVDISALASKIKENYPKVNKVRSRIRAVYNDGKRQQQVIVQLRIEAQKTIWMSASMVIPIAKLLITQEGVSFYEKFQKNYFKGNFDLINDPFNTTFSYEDVERLLLGKPFLDLNVGKWKQISNPQYYILIPQGSKSGFQPIRQKPSRHRPNFCTEDFHQRPNHIKLEPRYQDRFLNKNRHLRFVHLLR